MIVALALGVSVVHAQVSVEAGAGISWNSASSNFLSLPDVPTCCAAYRSGSGVAAVFYLGVELPVATDFAFGVRLWRSNASHTLVTDEQVDVVVNDRLVTAQFAHELEATLRGIAITPYLRYTFAKYLYAGAGVELHSVSSATYDQRERLVSPDNLRYRDGTGVLRLASQGALRDASSLLVSGVFSVGMHLPLDARRTWTLRPEIGYHIGISDMVAGLDWKVSSLRPTIALRYTFPTSVPPAAEASSVRPVESSVAPVPPLAPSTTSAAVSPLRSLAIRTVMVPLLPYIFFDAGQSGLSARYRTRVSVPDSSGVVRARMLQDMPDYQVHAFNIPIIAERLKNNPSAILVLHGVCSADDPPSVDLAAQRAAEILKRFLDAGVPGAQLQIRASIATPVPTVSRDANVQAVQEENRRVELSSTDPSILDPIILADTAVTYHQPGGSALPQITYTQQQRFSLIQFDFNSSDLSPHQQRLMNIINDLVRGADSITVTGSTDVLGDAEHNRTLSQKRAISVGSRILGNVHAITGAGEDVQADQTLPEQRMLRRSVVIQTNSAGRRPTR